MNLLFFLFNDTPTTDIYTLSLHDALPIYNIPGRTGRLIDVKTMLELAKIDNIVGVKDAAAWFSRSEEHTSELQSLTNLVCRLLLEKKKKNNKEETNTNDTYLLNVFKQPEG